MRDSEVNPLDDNHRGIDLSLGLRRAQSRAHTEIRTQNGTDIKSWDIYNHQVVKNGTDKA